MSRALNKRTYQKGSVAAALFISNSLITAAAMSDCMRSFDLRVAAAATAAAAAEAPLEAAACCKIF